MIFKILSKLEVGVFSFIIVCTALSIVNIEERIHAIANPSYTPEVITTDKIGTPAQLDSALEQSTLVPLTPDELAPFTESQLSPHPTQDLGVALIEQKRTSSGDYEPAWVTYDLQDATNDPRLLGENGPTSKCVNSNDSQCITMNENRLLGPMRLSFLIPGESLAVLRVPLIYMQFRELKSTGGH